MWKVWVVIGLLLLALLISALVSPLYAPQL